MQHTHSLLNSPSLSCVSHALSVLNVSRHRSCQAAGSVSTVLKSIQYSYTLHVERHFFWTKKQDEAAQTSCAGRIGHLQYPEMLLLSACFQCLNFSILQIYTDIYSIFMTIILLSAVDLTAFSIHTHILQIRFDTFITFT